MSHTRRPLAGAIALAAVVALATPLPAQKPYDDPILERMRKDIFYLASPELEGRGIETKGIEKAANYVAGSFKKSGLKPAMKNGSYFQPFVVPMSAQLGKPTTLTITGTGEKIEPKLGAEYTPMGFSGTSKAVGELVFAGFGITAPELKYDDYAGLDVKGKFVVILRRTPRYGEKGNRRFDTNATRDEDSNHAAFATKIDQAAKHKAAGLIIVNDSSAAGKNDPIPTFQLHATGTTPSDFPILFAKRALIDELLANAKQKSLKEIEETINDQLKPVAFELKGLKATAQVTVDRKQVNVKNVVGVLEGAGPLKDETVVIGAHYDHVGYGLWGSTGGAAARGKIHLGADDNASGTTGLLELARRFGAMKDRQGRRLVFIAFSAEEHGLDGSRFYCKEPIFPLKSTAAMVNMDMIGRTKPVPVDWLGMFGEKDRLVVYGTGTGEGFERLIDTVRPKFDFKITTIPGGTGPSDHDSFYRKGVPVLFLYTGMHPEYHKPTDVPEKINVRGMKKTVDLVEVLLKTFLTCAKPKYIVVKGGSEDPTAPPRGPSGPKLGFLPGNYESKAGGVLVDGVTPGGVAAKSGVKGGDFIVEIAGLPTPNITAYMTAMSRQKLGTTIDIVVERKGVRVTLKAKLE